MNDQKISDLAALIEDLLVNGPDMSDAEEDILVSKIESLSPDPHIMDRIFHPEDGEVSPVDIATEAFDYKPIEL